jgi:hypothetical protein
LDLFFSLSDEEPEEPDRGEATTGDDSASSTLGQLEKG